LLDMRFHGTKIEFLFLPEKCEYLTSWFFDRIYKINRISLN
jgi:hypothetical protein